MISLADNTNLTTHSIFSTDMRWEQETSEEEEQRLIGSGNAGGVNLSWHWHRMSSLGIYDLRVSGS